MLESDRSGADSGLENHQVLARDSSDRGTYSLLSGLPEILIVVRGNLTGVCKVLHLFKGLIIRISASSRFDSLHWLGFD